MKKAIKISVVFLFMTSIVLTSCDSSEEKIEAAKTEVLEAQKKLDKAKEVLLAEVEIYKKETAEKIEANKKVFAELKTTMKNVKEGVVENLELKNRDLQTKIDLYRVEGKEKWEEFKLEFDHDMNELAKAVADLKMKNVDK